ncbi:cysteine proteinase [Amniculicola lignicola CBS 123094]|uniref:Cysteine proteinase n=1 Tax=Amniculicola lignicola CBS 123094 TaxID=1392246 RepID=A0A6A5X0A7_9PLEO|nr:cysteine proteinase [Amniculicola lignicola CBS 123094]
MSSMAGDDDDPQQILNQFWENLITKKPSKVTKIFPPSLYQNLLPPKAKVGTVKGKNAAASYEAAAEECRIRVKRIVKECHRTNEKFSDPEFDIEDDEGTSNCLNGLMTWFGDESDSETGVDTDDLGNAIQILAAANVLAQPAAVDLHAVARIFGNGESQGKHKPTQVHRIDWIFEDPHFTVDGFSSSDVQQGANGDCWFIAAVAMICSNQKLIERVCVARDEECGVYGFVFYRDGEWVWTVVDDNLYLHSKDFDAYGDNYDPTGAKERKFRKNYQTGSDALYFASCADQNETWLPLLEKAFAKIHGDYDSIAGGNTGEAVEDLTGGVTTKVMTNKILSKDRLWKELMCVNEEFLFSASSPGDYGDDSDARRGLALGHAYSIIKAVEEEDEEGKKHRLVLIRNPWGSRNGQGIGEWNGPWSDGSKEWTPYWMKALDYRFADDGIFWMAYGDLCKRFDVLDRTRLFDESWTIVQNWTSVSVAWVTGYLNTKFSIEIKKAGPTVFVLCQLDYRYFRGLEGKYRFDLHFLLQEEGAAAGDHIVRARGAWFGNRSISCEVDLEPGKYELLPKIVAIRDAEAPEVHDVVTKVADRNPQKLRQIGLNYDIANAKGVVELTEEEQKKKDQKAKEAKEKKLKEKEEADKEKAEFEQWKKEKKEREQKEKAAKEKEKHANKEEGEKIEEKKEEGKEDNNDENKKEDLPAAEISKDTEESDSEETSSDEDGQETTKEDEPKSEAAGEEKPKPEDEESEASESEAEADDTPTSGDGPHGRTVGFPNAHLSGAAPDDDYASPGAAEPPPYPSMGVSKQNPWNAVCVIGLRVYSQDAEVSIKLVEPKNVEEGAVLNADGAAQAGATM